MKAPAHLPFSPFLRATTWVLAILVRRDYFSRSRRVLAGLSGRLHGLVQDVEAYSLHSGMQRVIGYLLRDVPDAGPSQAAEPVQVLLPVSKATIASRLSLTPEYFSRVLHELEAAGLIVIDKREIRIPAAFPKLWHTAYDWGYTTEPEAGLGGRDHHGRGHRALDRGWVPADRLAVPGQQVGLALQDVEAEREPMGQIGVARRDAPEHEAAVRRDAHQPAHRGVRPRRAGGHRP